MSLLIDLTLRTSAIALAGLCASLVLQRRSAALRHGVLAATIFAAAALPLLGLLLPAWDIGWRDPLPAPAVSAMTRLPASAVASVAEALPTARPSVGAGTVLAIVWAIGFVVSAGALLAGLLRLRRLASRAPEVGDGRWAETAARVSGAYGLARPVRLLRTDQPGLLATWGLLRPAVLLPEAASDWSDERVRIVLCHELAHVRRHDWFVQICGEALRAIHWFNPLVWLTCVQLRRESERACDDLVLGTGVPARDYAAHLLEVARSCRPGAAVSTPSMAMARSSTLERRIAAMLNPGLDRRALTRRALAITVLLLSAIALPVAAVRATQTAPLPLTGVVYDSTGAVMPGVELTLRSASGGTMQATTEAAGRFVFASVAPGRYVLDAALAGFGRLRHEFDLKVARDWERAVTLQVGTLRETINVRERRVAATQPSTPSAGTHALRVGGNIRPPRKQHDVKPVYPKAMRDAGREGVVPLEAIIGVDGTVQSVRVVSAQVHPDFVVAAVDAVRQWLFDPTLLNGNPVEVMMTVSVQFSLSDD